MTHLLRQPSLFQGLNHVVAAESTRLGGVSLPPYCSLNLGKSTADDPAHVAENRRRFCAALGFEPSQLVLSKQVHGDQIHTAERAEVVEGYDALITAQPGLLLAVSVADCTPILIFDPEKRVVAAIHAGWRGTAAGIVLKTLLRMQAEFGTQGTDCLAYIGTCIDECSFEVGAEVAAAFAANVKRFDGEKGKYFVDLKRANTAQCRVFGILPQHIEISPYSTVLHNDTYFSHRLEHGTTGRMMAAIGLR